MCRIRHEFHGPIFTSNYIVRSRCLLMIECESCCIIAVDRQIAMTRELDVEDDASPGRPTAAQPSK